MADRENILKAKIEFHRTFLSICLPITIALTIGTWAVWDNETARLSLILSGILMAIATFLFWFLYDKRHKQYIDFLRGK